MVVAFFSLRNMVMSSGWATVLAEIWLVGLEQLATNT